MMNAMPNILIRNLPEEVHRKLVDRAKADGRPLQAYLVSELSRAHTVSLEELITDIERNEGGRVGFAQAVEDLDQSRTRE